MMSIKKNKKSKDDYFIAPINLPWAIKAGNLAGHAFHVAIAIWYAKGLRRKGWGQPFSIGVTTAADKFGVSRSSVGRALKLLEQHGLISIKRRNGVSTVVAVLKPEKLNKETHCGNPQADESFFENLEQENPEHLANKSRGNL